MIELEVQVFVYMCEGLFMEIGWVVLVSGFILQCQCLVFDLYGVLFILVVSGLVWCQ